MASRSTAAATACAVIPGDRIHCRAVLQRGPITVAELARRLKRDYSNVHNDCERLIEWMAIEKEENGLVFAPYSETAADMKRPNGRAA